MGIREPGRSFLLYIIPRSTAERLSCPSGKLRTCTMRGSVILAMRPTMLWSTGTSRQPAMVHRPSAATTFSTICLACAASLSSFGRNSMPTLHRPT